MSREFGNSSWPRLAVAAGSIIVVGLIIGVAQSLEWAGTEPDDTGQPYAEGKYAALVERIAEESLGSFPAAKVIAAPKVATSRGALGVSEDPAALPVDALPSGYSYVEFHGEMAKAAITGRDGEARRRNDQGPQWIGSENAVQDLVAQAADAGRDWSFGWIRLAEQARVDDLARALYGTGAEIVGASGRLIRARLPADAPRLRELSALPEVAGLGTAPVEIKLEAVAQAAPSLAALEEVPVFVTLMDADPDGRWRRELENLGAVVGHYDPAIRVYAANATRDVLEAMAAADFVMAVEPVGIVEAAHDTAVPAMGADALRMYQGSPGLFSGIGGASVPIAVMDTGLNVNHLDISTNRSSICGANFVYVDPLFDDEDLWVDAGGHGTHVTGTVVGNGAMTPKYAGMAPLVAHIRFAKVLNHFGGGNSYFILRGMDFLAQSTACPESGWSSDAVKPLIVNMSFSASSLLFEGRSASERKLDAVVWDRRQLYVVAQSNEDIHGFSDYAAAKNSLAVGAAFDGGEVVPFSSHGPTADGRLAPQIMGAGFGVHSAAGDGSRGGYVNLSGTSMASPAVAGVAALLMDAVPAHRERPALVRARLMASAIKPDAWLEDPGAFPADNSNGPGQLQKQYGLGKVSARTSVLNRNQPGGWTSGSAVSELEDGEYAYHDIRVPEGASRLDVVLTWDEPPADTLASAVLNDLDLWLDHGGNCESEPCGEHASRSRVDNVEWIVVRNPEPGIYRAKVAATRVYTDAPRAALAWTTIRGASTPSLKMAVDKKVVEDNGELTLSLAAEEYIAAGTQLHIDCRLGDGSGCSTTKFSLTAEREDGVAQVVAPELGESMDIGELAPSETWKAKLDFGAFPGSGAVRLYFKASAWNANGAMTSVLWRAAGSDEAPPEAAAPANGLFSNATPVKGGEGTAELDLIRALTEPGEPPGGYDGRPAGSVWYEWTAPSDDMVSFITTALTREHSTDTRQVDVFRGDRITALERIAGPRTAAQFFAESGNAYRIRVRHQGLKRQDGRAPPLALNWSSGPRPMNDDFAAAAVIEAARGSAEGSTAGATLEPGEFVGNLASTVWFRWTAPGDGAWRFFSDAGAVAAFTGKSLPDLRLVSGFVGVEAVFPAQGGDTYHIAVAQQSGSRNGRPFKLQWHPASPDPGNDGFAGAEEMPATASGSHRVGIDPEATAEPGEPAESGIRTKWWAWTAPADGRYTWRIDELTRETSRPSVRLMVSAFEGEDLGNLQLAGTNGARMSEEFAFAAVGGRRYWLSVGMPARDPFAFTDHSWRKAEVTLVWGLAPGNDHIVNAAPLRSAYGAASGSNLFATRDAGVRLDLAGRSAVWWTFEAPADGWYRFSADGEGGPWAVTAFGGDGAGIAASSQWQRTSGDQAEVLFYAEAGSSHAISLGTTGGNLGGEFRLRWDRAEPPAWLRYQGRLADGSRDRNGRQVEIRMPGDLAFGGEALYFASGLGLTVFERNAANGELSVAQRMDGDFERSSMAYDRERGRLLAHDCGTWRSFGIAADGAVEAPLDLDAADDPARCGRLLVHPEGAFVYRIGESGIDAFAVEADGRLRFADYYEGYHLAGAALSANGFLYGSTGSELVVLETDTETGEWSRTVTDTALASPSWQDDPLAAAGGDGTLLFVDDGEATHAFSIEDPLDPVRLATLPKTFPQNRWGFAEKSACVLAAARGDAAIDVFCEAGWGYVAEWRPTGKTLEETDRFQAGGADRWNNALPDYGEAIGIAESPDQRHIYLSTQSHGILVFERVAAPAEAQRLRLPAGPDLVVELASVSDASVVSGSDFEFTAIVRNRGKSESGASRLRYYRSSDAEISSGDVEVASEPVPSLAGRSDRDVARMLNAPSGDGTYYFGVCADPVADELDAGNNCSAGVALRVEAPDLVVENPSVDDPALNTGQEFVLKATVRNRGSAESEPSTLRYYRSSDATISPQDEAVGTDTVAELSAGAAREAAIQLSAPTSAGRHYYGACIDAVKDESETANNCSTGVMVEVSHGPDEPDDHADYFSDATSVPVPSITDGKLGAGDFDMFQFDVNQAAILVVETLSGIDTTGSLWDGDGQQIAFDDDSGPHQNFRIEQLVSAGKYYIGVAGFTQDTEGRYRLSVRTAE